MIHLEKALLSPETDGKLVRKPSNNIPKSILMKNDPVIDTPSSFVGKNSFFRQNCFAKLWVNIFLNKNVIS